MMRLLLNVKCISFLKDLLQTSAEQCCDDIVCVSVVFETKGYQRSFVVRSRVSFHSSVSNHGPNDLLVSCFFFTAHADRNHALRFEDLIIEVPPLFVLLYKFG